MTSRYSKLEISLRYYLVGARYYTALKAMDFASNYHTGLRKDGITPEFEHQIVIAHFVSGLKDIMFEENTIAVALLHDVLEDYKEVSVATLDTMFGKQITNSCVLLDKTGKSYELYFEAISKDPVASIVKGVDRIHNVNSMVGVFTKEKQKKYIGEVNNYFLSMLKKARKIHPQQMQAYFNIMFMLRSQVGLLEGNL